MIWRFSSHWLIPNCSRISPPFRTTNFSSNFSLSSRCHWKVRFAGHNDENPLYQAAKLQLPDEQTRHDRFAGTRIVGQQKTHARQLEQIVVNRFKLVRKRIDAGNRKTEVRVELVGDTEHVRLKSEPQQFTVACVRAGRLLDRQLLEISRGKRYVAKTLGLNAD